MGASDPIAAVQAALGVHQAAGEQRRRELLNVATATDVADKLTGASSQRTFQNQQTLQDQRLKAEERRSARTATETRRHNLASERTAQTSADARKSYYESIKETKKVAQQAAADKQKDKLIRDDWKAFHITTSEIARAARSKKGVIPYELYDTWAQQAVKLQKQGEEINVTIPFTASSFWGSETIELTPGEWLEVRKQMAKFPDVDPSDFITHIKAWRQQQSGANPK